MLEVTNLSAGYNQSTVIPNLSFKVAPQEIVAIVGRNPSAIWFSGYIDRIIFDELGLFDEYLELDRISETEVGAVVSSIDTQALRLLTENHR